jgi:hypothetical protein
MGTGMSVRQRPSSLVDEPPDAGSTAPPSAALPVGRRTRASAADTILRTVREHPLPVAFVTLAVGVRVVFWLYTGRVWEDAYTTLASARSLLHGHGHGLTQHPGEPAVQSFTSVTGLGVALVGQLFGHALFFVRMVSIAAACVTVVYAYRLAQHLRLGRWPTVFLLGFLALDQHQVFFGMAGMETQLAVAVAMVGVYSLLRDRLRQVGVCAGFAVLTRPDFVLWVGVVVLLLVLRRDRWNALARFLVPALVVIGPWALFATAYYGSPVPNTIHAKNLYQGVGFGYSPSLGEMARSAGEWWRGVAPIYESSFVARSPMPRFWAQEVALTFGALAVLGLAAFRKERGVLAIGCLVGAFLAYRARALVPSYFTWYLPPFTALAAVCVSAGLARLSRAFPRSTAILSASLVLAYAIHIPFSYPIERRLQRTIEDGVRRRVGQYLGSHMKPHDTAVLEPIGYFGWFAGAHTIYDFPGLTSKRVTDILDNVQPAQRSLPFLIERLKPHWAVLRPHELDEFRRDEPQVARDYEVAEVFTSAEEPNLRQWGLEYFTIDRTFVVLRRAGQ